MLVRLTTRLGSACLGPRPRRDSIASDQLAAAFATFGTIVNLDRKPQGYAFLDYADLESAEAAVASESLPVGAEAAGAAQHRQAHCKLANGLRGGTFRMNAQTCMAPRSTNSVSSWSLRGGRGPNGFRMPLGLTGGAMEAARSGRWAGAARPLIAQAKNKGALRGLRGALWSLACRPGSHGKPSRTSAGDLAM